MSIRHLAAFTAAAALATATTAAAVPAHATTTVTCGAHTWKASYYANTTFKGTPRKTVCDTKIAENYGTGDPAGVTLPKDDFGVRWTLTRNFGSGGPFGFSAAAQDGIRVYLDGKLDINLWKDVTKTQRKTVNLTVPRGTHTVRVDFAAFRGKADVAFAYAPRTSASVDKVAPLAPAGLHVTYSGSTGRAGLTWSRNVEMDLAGYRVYRRFPTATTWTRISGAGPVTSTGFTDTPPATGAKYVYVVTAVDRAGRASGVSAPVTVTSIDRKAPAAPTGVRATYSESTGAVKVTWAAGKEGDLRSYRVYRRTGADGAWVRLAPDSTPSTELFLNDQLPGGTAGTYSYAVTAVDASGNQSARSQAPSVTLTETSGPPAAVTGLTGTAEKYGVELDWDAGTAADLDHYEVSTGSWEINAYTGEPYFEKDTTAVVAAGTTHYRLVKALGSRPVSFLVVAVDTAGNATVDTVAATLDVTPIDMVDTPYPAPGTLAVRLDSVSETGAGGVLLDWYCSNASVCDRITGYNVYDFDYTTRAFVKLDAAPLPTVPSSWTDTTPARGTTHVYQVTAVLDDGTESFPSWGSIALAPAG
ncbi:PA14 domain-containing protein [Streptomyces sp. NPDC088354]|uniref:PA14 domain-containing protein n=1 Tax=Streptomyces sp. NPDC088354 TaxID=3365856 RepID=UPI003828C3E1